MKWFCLHCNLDNGVTTGHRNTSLQLTKAENTQKPLTLVLPFTTSIKLESDLNSLYFYKLANNNMIF